VIICALVLVLPAAARRADTPTLTAIVGTNDGFTITLNDASGKKVSRIAPGTYTVLVEDRSALHDFHLASNEDATVDFRTDLEFVGEKSFTVTFRDDTRYAYACEPHWQVMNGEFFVTNTPAPSPPPPPAPVRKLSVIVKSGGAVVLSRASVPAGRYRLTVEDHGRPANGSAEAGLGYGLTGMRERAELLDGRLAADRTPDGFRVELYIPQAQ